MQYTDKIEISENDNNYKGGQLFISLYKGRRLVEFKGCIKETGLIPFSVNRHCYVEYNQPLTTTRAIILADPSLQSSGTYRLLLVQHYNPVTREIRLLEVVPEIDDVDNFMQQIYRFIGAEYLGTKFYEGVIEKTHRRALIRTCRNLAGGLLGGFRERVELSKDMVRLLEYTVHQRRLGAGIYGCMQRSRNEKIAKDLDQCLNQIINSISMDTSIWGSRIGDRITGDIHLNAVALNILTENSSVQDVSDALIYLTECSGLTPPTKLNSETLAQYFKDFTAKYSDFFLKYPSLQSLPTFML